MKAFGLALFVGALTMMLWSTINLAFGDPPGEAVRLAFWGGWGAAIGFLVGAWTYHSGVLP
jgi:hypothetical protein